MADDLRSDMEKGFARVDERFARVDERFARVDERFARVDERFDRVDERFDRVDEELTAMRAEFAAVRADIKQSAEDTRRYFQILSEDMRDGVKRVAEVTAHNSSRLDDHERRLKTLEKPRRT
jgi:chromosome segregation ATPase